MAATGTGAFAAGLLPLTLRRDAFAATVTAQSRPIPKSKLSVHASAARIEKQHREVYVAHSVSGNGVSGKKAEAPLSSGEAEDRRSSLRGYFEQSVELISESDGGPPRWFSPLECGSPLKDSPLLLYLPGLFIYLIQFICFEKCGEIVKLPINLLVYFGKTITIVAVMPFL